MHCSLWMSIVDSNLQSYISYALPQRYTCTGSVFCIEHTLQVKKCIVLTSTFLSSSPPSFLVFSPPPPPPSLSFPPPPPRSLSSLPFLPSLSPCPLSPLLFSLSSLFLFKARTVVKAALELLVVFVNYSEQSDSLGTNMSAKGMDSPRMNSPEGQSTPLVFKNAVNIVSENKGISMGNMFCV